MAWDPLVLPMTKETLLIVLMTPTKVQMRGMLRLSLKKLWVVSYKEVPVDL